MSARPDASPFDFAALVRDAVATDGRPVPSTPSAGPSALALACRDYFTAMAMADAPGVSEAVTNLGCEQMEAAARRLAEIPSCSFGDIRAKTLFVLEAMAETGQLTAAEHAVLQSVADDALALKGVAE